MILYRRCCCSSLTRCAVLLHRAPCSYIELNCLHKSKRGREKSQFTLTGFSSLFTYSFRAHFVCFVVRITSFNGYLHSLYIDTSWISSLVQIETILFQTQRHLWQPHIVWSFLCIGEQSFGSTLYFIYFKGNE